MAHVVLHCAEYRSSDAANLAAEALMKLKEDYASYEARALQSRRAPHGGSSSSSPETIPPPFVAFGERHGFVWPSSCRFSIKGFADEIEVVAVDRLVVFYVGGFELGGKALASYFAGSGAIRYVSDGGHLVMQVAEAVDRARELAAFLVDEDYEGQFTLRIDGEVQGAPPDEDDAEHDEEFFLFTVTLTNAEHTCVLGFDDSGVQDWAFVSLLYQLSGMDPTLDPARVVTQSFGNEVSLDS
jgi:hypothetical protein